MMKLARKQSIYDTYSDYMHEREKFFQKNKDEVYKTITFSEEESKANQLWQKMIQADRFNRNHTYYHTYTLRHREEYEKGDIFKVLKNMPKGATHHIHVDCCVGFDWFYDEMAFDGNCYVNRELGMFHFFKDEKDVKEGYINMIQVKDVLGDEQCRKFTKQLISVTQEEAEDFNHDIWESFEKKILSLSAFLYNTTIYPKYLRHVIKSFIDDGVYRIEANSFIGWIIDENLQPIDSEAEVKIYKDAIKEMQEYCPHFSYGLIVQGLKVWDEQQISEYYENAYKLRAKYPELVIAFDMVQEEDAYQSLIHIAQIMIKQTEFEAKYQIEFPLILHAGESLDNQLNTNLYDAIKLHCKRIGHGINLVQHSNLIEEIKRRNICLENCPMSNQVLRYVNDIRIHPLRSFINANVAVTISPDDPGIFGVVGVTQDFYVGTIGSRLTLRDLKLLVNNSITYSLGPEEDLNTLKEQTYIKWDEFIKWFLKTYDNPEHVSKLDTLIGTNPPKRFF